MNITWENWTVDYLQLSTVKNFNLELNPVTDLSWQDGVMESLKEGPPEFKFSVLSRSAESPLNTYVSIKIIKKCEIDRSFSSWGLVVNADQFYTQCWLFLIDFLQTSQVPGVEVFLCAKSGSIRRFPDCTRITFFFLENYIVSLKTPLVRLSTMIFKLTLRKT